MKNYCEYSPRSQQKKNINRYLYAIPKSIDFKKNAIEDWNAAYILRFSRNHTWVLHILRKYQNLKEIVVRRETNFRKTRVMT